MKGVWLSKSEWTPWSRTAGERGRFQHQDVRFKPGISVTHGHKSSLLLVAHDDSQATSGQGQHDLLVSPDLVTWGWAPVTQCFPPAPKGKRTRSEVSLLPTAAAFDKLTHERKPQAQEGTFLTFLIHLFSSRKSVCVSEFSRVCMCKWEREREINAITVLDKILCFRRGIQIYIYIWPKYL